MSQSYRSLQEIEDAFAEPANETPAAKRKRIAAKRKAIKRFNDRQQSSQSYQIQTRSQTAATSDSASQIQTQPQTAVSSTAYQIQT